MTIEHYNSLPIEVRSFIQNHAGCLACGRTEAKLDRAYQLYLNSKKMSVYTLFGGGINYVTESGESGVLYNVNPNDTPFQIREKIRIAKSIRAVRPHSFSAFNEKEIEDLLNSLPAVEVVEIEDTLEDEGFNIKEASYADMRDFIKNKGVEVEGQSKAAYIEAIKEFQSK